MKLRTLKEVWPAGQWQCTEDGRGVLGTPLFLVLEASRRPGPHLSLEYTEAILVFPLLASALPGVPDIWNEVWSSWEKICGLLVGCLEQPALREKGGLVIAKPLRVKWEPALSQTL